MQTRQINAFLGSKCLESNSVCAKESECREKRPKTCSGLLCWPAGKFLKRNACSRLQPGNLHCSVEGGDPP